MNLRKTLLLAALLAILTVAIFYRELPISERITGSYLLPDFQPDGVQNIEIANSNGTFRFKREALGPNFSMDPDFTHRWLFDSPVLQIAERAILDELLKRLAKSKHRGEIPASERESDLAIYGLAKPVAKLNLHSGAQIIELQLGKFSSYAKARYVLRNGELLLADDGILEIISLSQDELRDKTPVEFLDPDVRTLTIEGSARKMRLELREGMQWVITDPIESSTDLEAMVGLTRSLRSFSVLEFFDAGKIDPAEIEFARAALAKPDLSVRIEFSPVLERKTLQFKLAVSRLYSDNPETGTEEQTDEEVYLEMEGDPTIYLLASNPLPGILRPLEDFRQKKYMLFDPASVSELQVTKESGVLNILRTAEQEWSVNGKLADPPFIAQLLKDLADLRVSGFVSSSVDSGLDNPKLVIRVKGMSLVGVDSEYQIKVGHKIDQAYYASISGSKDLVLIDESTFKKIDVREEQLVPINREEVR